MQRRSPIFSPIKVDKPEQTDWTNSRLPSKLRDSLLTIRRAFGLDTGWVGVRLGELDTCKI